MAIARIKGVLETDIEHEMDIEVVDSGDGKKGALKVAATFGAANVGLKNVADDQINPATEEKQDDIIAALGGGSEIATPTNSGFAFAGTSSETIVAANANRGDLTLTNISDTIMYLSRATPAVIEQGLPLIPNGVLKIGPEWKGIVYGICSVSGKKIAIEEGSTA